MKKLALIVLAVFSISNHIDAQFDNLRLGIYTSPTVSWISTNNNLINKTGSNIGFRAGFVGEYFFGENLALSGGIGLGFGQGGTLQHENGGNFWPNSELSDDRLNTGDKPLPDGVKLKYKLQYLELPIAFKVRSNEKGYLRYFGEFPILTIGMNTQARGNIEGREVESVKENIAKDVNFFNFQLGLGGGLEYAISPNTSLVAGLYFNVGLSDITGNDGVTAIDNPEQAPSNPNDDYIFVPETSVGRLSNVSLRIAIMF